MRIEIIIVSTRQGRQGPIIGKWFSNYVAKDKRFEASVADLAEINLPMMDEPNHPKMKEYTHEYTKEWSRRIDNADGFVIVTPEYNFSAPAPLINALDYLYSEWNYKPAGFVSYGGVSGGTRAVEHIKQILTTLKVVPIYEAVNIPFFSQKITDGTFIADEHNEKAAQAMLDELYRWHEALIKLRK
jgi:NAD(P)H-dependent FMN reductase